MDDGEFSVWLLGIDRLSAAQRATTFHRLEAERDEDERAEATAASGRAEGCVEAVGTSVSGTGERRRLGRGKTKKGALDEIGWRKVESAGCPHCGGRELIAWGSARALARYRCKTCRRTFSALTKTPMAHLHKKDRWFEQSQAMIEGLSLAKAAARCGVHPSTAYRWRHRFLGAPALDKPRILQGIVEADETFILESLKGARSGLKRKPRRRGGRAKHPGLFMENIPVLVARDRAGATFDAVLPEVSAACVGDALTGVVTPANRLVCDGGMALRAFARKARIPVCVVPAPGKPAPETPDIHINNVNAYHGRLKEWMRRFHGVATKNLPNYLGWRRALEAWGDNLSPQAWVLGACGIGPYQHTSQ